MNSRAVVCCVGAARAANHLAIICRRVGDTWRARMHVTSRNSCMRMARQLRDDEPI